VPIVAKGSKTEAQVAQLKALGCNFTQGFLMSRPVRYEELKIFLAGHSS